MLNIGPTIIITYLFIIFGESIENIVQSGLPLARFLLVVNMARVGSI